MDLFLGSIFWFLVATGLLVSFHEFGHFWVARRFGVRVLRFSVGLGKPLWTKIGRDGTEYVIAAIPLGGYVKMLDEREADVAPRDLDGAFNRKPLGQRATIVAAGPIFNLVFALAAFWLMFMVGVRDYSPYVGESTGVAASAGIEAGDRIVALDGEEVSNWTHVLIGLTTRAYRGAVVDVAVEQADGVRTSRRLDLSTLGERVDEERFLAQLGIKPWHWVPPAIIGQALPDQPAALAGLQAGDQVLAIGEQPVTSFRQMGEAIQVVAASNEGRLPMRILRDGREQRIEVTARSETIASGSVWRIGVAPDQRETVRRHGAFSAVPQAFKETWSIMKGSYQVIYHMIMGDAQLKNVAGPITIAQYAGYSAEAGFVQYLRFLGLISLALCIMNLLPIPILDGGHLLYYFIEWVKGGPLSDRAQAVGHYMGLGALLGLMGLAVFNDLSRLLFS